MNDTSCETETDECGELRRLGLQITYDGDTQTIFDGHTGRIGEYDGSYRWAVVSVAHRYEDLTCEGTSVERFLYHIGSVAL